MATNETTLARACLLVHDVPYVNAQREVGRATLASALVLAGDVAQTPSTHVALWTGDFPCNMDGTEITALKHAVSKEKLAEGLTARFSFSNKPPTGKPPSDLSNPSRQVKIHDGRKRIDITYTNTAETGFFRWLSKHKPSMYILVECKNYAGDPKNPELDQLSGRFSPSRGRVGLLVCQRLEDKELFIQRCRDTANDDRGFVIPLDDLDLARLVSDRQGPREGWFSLLRERLDALIL